jgi:tRNA(Ile)-lysidine synthase
MAVPTPERLLQALDLCPDAPRLWVALSGGLDSTVLLHALAAARELRPLDLAAIHVDHGLSPAAGDWADHCRRLCNHLAVPLTLRRLSLQRQRGESLEALAREGRYAALSAIAGPGDLVLTAQHQDDQAETLLLALLRGSGVKGLAAMPRRARLGGAWLLRPLLGYRRAELLAYARAQGLTWIEDPSNGDLDFDRNYLRARILPLLAERWPACAASLSRSAAHCAEAQDLIAGLAAREISRIGGSRPGTLSLAALGVRAPALQAAVLRHWFSDLGLPTPDSRHLGRIRAELMRARPDRTPLVAWPGCETRRYRDDLYAMTPLPPVPGAVVLEWRAGELPLPAGLGCLRLLDRVGARQDPVACWPSGLEVRFGARGLRCRRADQPHQRRLKHLFQEAAIPSWLRPYVPCLFDGAHLVAVGDLWRCILPTADDGIRLHWEGGIRDHPGFWQAAGQPPGHRDPELCPGAAARSKAALDTENDGGDDQVIDDAEHVDGGQYEGPRGEGGVCS